MRAYGVSFGLSVISHSFLSCMVCNLQFANSAYAAFPDPLSRAYWTSRMIVSVFGSQSGEQISGGLNEENDSIAKHDPKYAMHGALRSPFHVRTNSYFASIDWRTSCRGHCKNGLISTHIAWVSFSTEPTCLILERTYYQQQHERWVWAWDGVRGVITHAIQRR